MLQKVMQEDSSCWDAHRFLRELEVTNPHVRCRVKYDERNGRPKAITWMLLEGREDLVRCGDVLFLDPMKRDCNRPGWPHIGPCVKDNENMVRVTAGRVHLCCRVSRHAPVDLRSHGRHGTLVSLVQCSARVCGSVDHQRFAGPAWDQGDVSPARRSMSSLEQSLSGNFWKQARLVVPSLADHDQRHSGGLGSCFPKCFQTLGGIPSAS
jgi:hypothetical protein